jgi:hypothetical protein
MERSLKENQSSRPHFLVHMKLPLFTTVQCFRPKQVFCPSDGPTPSFTSGLPLKCLTSHFNDVVLLFVRDGTMLTFEVGGVLFSILQAIYLALAPKRVLSPERSLASRRQHLINSIDITRGEAKKNCSHHRMEDGRHQRDSTNSKTGLRNALLELEHDSIGDRFHRSPSVCCCRRLRCRRALLISLALFFTSDSH